MTSGFELVDPFGPADDDGAVEEVPKLSVLGVLQGAERRRREVVEALGELQETTGKYSFGL
jgi:hypothetical protein